MKSPKVARKKLRTEMGWSTPDRIVVRGKDLPGELLGRINLGDMAWLELTGRMPAANESRMFNALLVTLVEHGITPSAIAARITYLGAPRRCRPRSPPACADWEAFSSAPPKAARSFSGSICRLQEKTLIFMPWRKKSFLR